LIAAFQLTFYSRDLCAQEKQQLLSWYDMGIVMEADRIDSTDYPIFTQYLDESGKEPTEYVVQKCKEHQLVILGETHHRKEYLNFFKKVLPEVYHRANVRYVVLEVALATHNAKLEKLVIGKSYDQDLAWEIIRTEGKEHVWGDKEYWEILESVWSLNQSLPEGSEPMRIIGIEIDFNFKLEGIWRRNKLEDKELIAQAESQQPLLLKRDELMAAAINQYVINKKAKGIVLIGGDHSFTHYSQPIPNMYDKHYAFPRANEDDDYFKLWPRMAHMLYQQHGDKIFQIVFHKLHRAPNTVFRNYDYKGKEPVIGKLIEKIMAERNDKPVGFDVFDSPFGLLRDSRSYYFHFQPSVQMSDICRGYIYLKPWNDILFSTWLDGYISDELYDNNRIYRLYYDKLWKREWQNAKEIDNWYKKSWEKYNQ
jgi:hypothetical protein